MWTFADAATSGAKYCGCSEQTGQRYLRLLTARDTGDLILTGMEGHEVLAFRDKEKKSLAQ